MGINIAHAATSISFHRIIPQLLYDQVALYGSPKAGAF